MAISLAPIGVVRSPVRDEVDENWGQVVAEVVLEPTWAAGLRGLEHFSHALIVFFMHRASFAAGDDLLRHPRGRTDLPLSGIFAQRAKHRPNPIGVTVVEVLGVRDNVLAVRGLDAIDGTPVLDIKPYFPQFDRTEGARVPAWVGEIMSGYF
ncbi:MAG: tRNA (N6-threonylcarbamoyladenosine(37)-N6)-methyltransferase TrmO [Chloroflexota bacterium]